MNLAPAQQPSRPRSIQPHRQLNRYLVALCVAASVLGCGGSNSSKSSAANIVLKDENNYKSESTLQLTNVTTASGEDIKVQWSGLTKNLQCHDVDPLTTIKNISLVRFANMTPEAAQKKLISGNLSTGDLALYREANTDGVSPSVQISTMKPLGGKGSTVVANDYVQKDSDTYVFIASNSTQAGIGAQSMVFVTPTEGDSKTTVDIPTGCGMLTFTAHLQNLTPVNVSATGPWIVDWSNVTKDSEGKDPSFIVLENYDLILGYYDIPISQIESDFFNVETLATKMWRIKNITGTPMSKDLGAAQDENGNLFTGFNQGGGVWLLGLQCPSCQNPAPLFLTTLNVGASQ